MHFDNSAWNGRARRVPFHHPPRETGMGFQLVEGSFWGRVAPLLVFNTERAYDLSTIGLEPGDDPATILRNGLKIVELLKSEIARTIIAAPSPRIHGLLGSRIGTLPPRSGAGQTALATWPLVAPRDAFVPPDDTCIASRFAHSCSHQGLTPSAFLLHWMQTYCSLPVAQRPLRDRRAPFSTSLTAFSQHRRLLRRRLLRRR
jgi:hypothetical protein